MKGKTICVFSDAAAAPVESIVTKFREEFEKKVLNQKIVLPRMTHASL